MDQQSLVAPSADTDRKAIRESDERLPLQAMEKMNLTEPCYSVKDAAAKLGLSESTVRDYLNDEAFGFEKLFKGRRRMILRADMVTIWVLRNSIYRPEIHKFDADKHLPPPKGEAQPVQEPRLRLKPVS